MNNLNKGLFSEFCREGIAEIPLFFQPWWMDLVCGPTNWDTKVVNGSAGTIQGVFHFYSQKYFGFKVIRQPLLTPYTGPLLFHASTEANPTSKLNFQIKLFKELLRDFPKPLWYNQHFHPQVDYWLPFRTEGYQCSTLYTFHLNLNQLDKVKANFKGNVKRSLNKAEGQIVVTEELPVDSFFRVYSQTFNRQRRQSPINFIQFERLHHALKERNQGRLFCALDRTNNQVHAVAYLVWDQQSAYYLLEGSDPALRKSGANLLLTWRAIQYTKEVLGLDRFDFLGSVLPNIEPSRRHFGAQPVPYFHIFKGKYKILEAVNALRQHP